MTNQEKLASKARRDETLKAKLIALIANKPGLEAKHIPSHLRRFLRPLEQAHVLKYERHGWHVTPAHTHLEGCPVCIHETQT